MKRNIVYYLLVLSFVIFVLNQDAVAQCAMCKATLESNARTGEANPAESLNAGILYLMVIPYLIFGVIAYLWYKNSKKEKGTT